MGRAATQWGTAMTTFAKSFARTRLAAALAAACGLAAPAARAATQTVENCSNSGAGSLRQAVAMAAPGDTVDLSGLTTASPGCSASAITLTTGAIAMTQDDLKVVGVDVESPYSYWFVCRPRALMQRPVRLFHDWAIRTLEEK